MIFGSPLLARLVALFKKMPGIGEKSAQRLALHVLRSDRAAIEDLARTLLDIKDKVGLCTVCANVAEGERCVICSDARRTDETLCIVEQPQDVYVVERTGAFHGRYQVLHGALSPIEGIGPEQLRIRELVERVRAGGIQEIILATNPSLEGDYTAAYLRQQLLPFSIKLTRLARGLPVGGDLEYADQNTLLRALAGRQELGE